MRAVVAPGLSPAALRPAQVLHLQRTVGNRAVGGILGAPPGGRLQRGTGSSKPAPKITKETVRQPDVALYVLKKAYSGYDIKAEAAVVTYDDPEEFAEAYKALNQATEVGDAVGFTVKSDRRSERAMHILTPEASFDATVHELVHHNASEAWNQEFRDTTVVHEGVTQLLTYLALRQAGLSEFSGAYADEMNTLVETNDGVVSGLATVLKAYFGGDKAAMKTPLGTQAKSLVQTANKVMIGEWEAPPTHVLDLGLDLPLQGGTGEGAGGEKDEKKT